MARHSRGTQIWFYDPTVKGESPIGLTKLICPTGFTVTSGTRETVETAPCLESGNKKMFSGSLTHGTASSPLNFDPQETSHAQLYALFKSGMEVDFALGFSGSDAEPTYIVPQDHTKGTWTLDNDRDWLTFEAIISSVPFEFDPAAAVVSGVEIQLVSFPNLIEATTYVPN